MIFSFIIISNIVRTYFLKGTFDIEIIFDMIIFYTFLY